MKKKWYESKLIWLGAFQFGYGVLYYFQIVTEVLSPTIIAGFFGFLTVVLRFVTKKEIVFKNGK